MSALFHILGLPGLVLFKGTRSQRLLKPSSKRLRIWIGLEGDGYWSQIIGKGSLASDTDSHSLEPKPPQVGASVSLHGGDSRRSPAWSLSPLALSRIKVADRNQAINIYICGSQKREWDCSCTSLSLRPITLNVTDMIRKEVMTWR